MSKKAEHTDSSFTKKMGTQEYSTRLTTRLNQLRKESSLCDITIIVGEQRFSAHKAVLSCASDYFQGMFSAGFQESTLSEVTVPGTEECFAQLLEFAYTGFFSLSLNTALGILRMACYMMMQDAMKLCATYLKDVTTNLSMDDCFELWTISKNHDILQDLTKASKNHLVHNFPECGKSAVFLENASIDVFLDMLTDEDIETDACGEEQIAEVVIAWLRHDWEHRKPHTADLLKKLHLGLLPVDTLQKVLGDEVLNIPECKAVVEEVMKLNATKEDADVPLFQSHPDLFATRNTVTGQLTRSGLEDFVCKTSSGCYKLDGLSDFPIKCPYLEQRCCSFVVINDSEIYIACGYEDTESDVRRTLPEERFMMQRTWLRENNFCKYDLYTNKWTVLKPMKRLLVDYRLYLHKLKDFIYAVGFDENSDLYLIQRYSLATKDWGSFVVDAAATPGKVVVVFDHAVVDEHILFTGYSYDDDDEEEYGGGQYDVYNVYNPTSDKLYEIVNNSHERSLEIPRMYTEVDEAGACYLRDELRNQVHRVICDFTSDVSSVRLQLQERGKLFEQCNRKDSQRSTVSFDKRKLKMAQQAMECDCHGHS